ncbi:hypothetical protein SAMN04515673_109105 [Poseidonocella sedimentorum]|uniref:Uncharacterized protein n=1 Tax=Poseidonocella sedimentorum TaxID=871652 RepID=A0A1I6EBX2_9RHOB|nr:hypothetical protein SAMN04515673_109105 [Poseidonocella sedimentorum]
MLEAGLAKRLGLALVCGLVGMGLASLLGYSGELGAVLGVVAFVLYRVSRAGKSTPPE